MSISFYLMFNNKSNIHLTRGRREVQGASTCSSASIPSLQIFLPNRKVNENTRFSFCPNEIWTQKENSWLIQNWHTFCGPLGMPKWTKIYFFFLIIAAFQDKIDQAWSHHKHGIKVFPYVYPMYANITQKCLSPCPLKLLQSVTCPNQQKHISRFDSVFLKIITFDLFSASEMLNKCLSAWTLSWDFAVRANISAAPTFQKHPTKVLKICGCVESLVEILHVTCLPLRINTSAF